MLVFFRFVSFHFNVLSLFENLFWIYLEMFCEVECSDVLNVKVCDLVSCVYAMWTGFPPSAAGTLELKVIYTIHIKNIFMNIYFYVTSKTNCDAIECMEYALHFRLSNKQVADVRYFVLCFRIWKNSTVVCIVFWWCSSWLASDDATLSLTHDHLSFIA